jgi:lipopolysaccharide/colanic/teichoic acid biosynthesis glycosyltransferase
VKVAIITANPLALPVFFVEQTRFLHEHGAQTVTISSPSRELITFGENTGTKVIPVSMSRRITPFGDLRAVFHLWTVLRREKPDIAHAHMPKGGLLGMTAAFLAGVPARCFTVHGLRSETENGWRLSLLRIAEWLTYRFATHVFAVSPSLRNFILQSGSCPPAKIRVLGHGGCAGVNTQTFDPQSRVADRKLTRKTFKIRQDATVICYAGRIAAAKGIADLHEAWTMLREDHPNLWLLLCGPLDTEDPVSPSVLQSLRNDIRVRMHETLESNMPSIFAAADICVQPSYREGLGVAALEANAMEKPVVAYRVGGLADAIRDRVTGFLVPLGDRRQLAAALERLIISPSLQQSMGKAGRRMVIQNFESSNVSRLLLQEYDLAVHPTGPTPMPGKRILDFLAALMLFVLTLPLLILGALAIRIQMGGPVFFRQSRGGLNGVPFTLCKFRTMSDARDESGKLLPDQDRLTSVGRFLRWSSIDELPQLWNVLRGEMSLVGPRPLLAEYLTRYSSFERRRHEVRPGITGLAQVSGRNSISWDETFALDIWYVDNRGWRLDAQILWMTFLRVVRPSGAHSPLLGARTEFQGVRSSRPSFSTAPSNTTS